MIARTIGNAVAARPAAGVLRCIGLAGLAAFIALAPARAEPTHGIAMHGNPAYPADFQHFSYVNPDAPKGGALRTAVLGSFDSLNPFIVRGSGVLVLRVTNLVFERLMARSYSEPFALYGLLAESVDMPADRSSIAFTLRPEARFSDGQPVTVEDVIFSFETLRDQGRPNYGAYYKKVATVEKTGPRSVLFSFPDSDDKELPLIIGLMPILPKHVYGNGVFERASLDPPVGSGPYRVTGIDAGAKLTMTRNPDYWGWDVPAVRGQYNFDTYSIEFFRDENTLFEAFKRGLFDLFPDTEATRWATGYDFPAARDGRVVQEEIANDLPKGMLGFVFNTRREIFADLRVRQALTLLFDFEWTNKTLYHGLWERTQSYFHGSELASTDHAVDDREAELLGDALERLPDDIRDGAFRQPVTDGSGRNRRNLRAALTLFEEAGYRLTDGKLVNTETGAPFSFEILVLSREQERLALSFSTSLERAGIDVAIRQVDSSQFEQRRRTYDFDMIQNRWYFSLSPGNEQGFYWGSEAARTEGTRNYMGVADPAVDRAITALTAAETREDLVSATRALDRLLLAGHYVLPLFHTPGTWMARWDTVARPDALSLWGSQPETWWSTAGE